jgi:hypothetical protein
MELSMNPESVDAGVIRISMVRENRQLQCLEDIGSCNL